MVNSFETVTTSLVQEEEFMEFEFSRDQLTVSAKVVSNYVGILILDLL